ncbi:MAG: hypothetical protein K8I00_13275, partial [Candidatus Omnitrophica bacterium]|nr:hypothetical protein [Candidatus Omnitrophota bacterium]
LSGRYHQYYADGSLRLLMVFKNGNCLKEREYAPDGKLVYWADHKPRLEEHPPQPNKSETGTHPLRPDKTEPENTQDYRH